MKSYGMITKLLVVAFMLMGAVVAPQSLYAQCVPPPSGMVAWWPLDETVGPTSNDIGGAVNNSGTWINNPVPVVTGKVAGALSFNGSNSVDVPDQAELNFGTGDFSIDLWIKTTNASGTRTILDKRTGSVPNITGYVLFLSNGYLGSQIGDGAGYNNYVSTTGFVANGNWHHVAVTVDRNNTSGWRHYVDGSVVGTPVNPTSYQGSLTNTAPFVMARELINPSHTFAGTLDEVELFNRVLDSSEVRSIWAADSLGKCKPDTCHADGDANNDGVGLTTADTTYLAQFIRAYGPAPVPLYSCDLNGDGFVNLADLQLYHLYFIFGRSVFDQYGGYPVPTCCDPVASGRFTESLEGPLEPYLVTDSGGSYPTVGKILRNPSLTSPMTVTAIGMELYQDENHPIDGSIDIRFSVWSVDSSGLPDSMLGEVVITGDSIAAEWPETATVYTPYVPLSTPVEIGPAEQWMVAVSPMGNAHGPVVIAGTRFDINPCCMTVVGRTSESQWVGIHDIDIEPSWEAIGREDIWEAPISVSYQYWRHFIKGTPLNNAVTITLGKTMAKKMYSGVAVKVNSQLMAYIGKSVWNANPPQSLTQQISLTTLTDQPEGWIPITYEIDGKVYRTNCYHLERCPLVYDAPWAVTTVTPVASTQKWQIDAETTPLTYTIQSWKFLGRTWESKLGLNGILDHWVDMRLGTSDISVVQNELYLKLLNSNVFSYNLPSTVTEIPGHDIESGSRQVKWNLAQYDFPPVYMTKDFDVPIVIEGFYLGSVCGGMSANIKTRGEVSLQAPGPTYGTAVAKGQADANGWVGVGLGWKKVLRAELDVGGDVFCQAEAVLSVTGIPPKPSMDFGFCLDADAWYEGYIHVPFKKWTTGKVYFAHWDVNQCDIFPRLMNAQDESDSIWLYPDPNDARWYQPYAADGETDGGEVIAVFVHQPEPGAEELYVSRFVDGAWTTPTPVTAGVDPVMDFALAKLDSGSFAVAYTAGADDFPVVDSILFKDAVQYYNTEEIRVARYNAATHTLVTDSLTENATPDWAARVVESQGTLYTAWTHHPSTDLADPAQVIQYAVFNGNTWTPPATLPHTGISLEAQLAANDSLTGAVVVWVDDADAVDSTFPDQQLKMAMISPSGAVTGSPAIVPSLLSPRNLNLTVTGTVRAVAYEWCPEVLNDSGVVIDTADLGAESRIAVSVYRNGSWSVYPVGSVDNPCHGTKPKIAIVGNTIHLVYCGFDGTPDIPNRRQIMYTTLSLTPGSDWMDPIPLTAVDDITDMSAITPGPDGLHVMYMRDTSETSQVCGGLAQGYEVLVDISCCKDFRGNVNDDPDDMVDISDVVYMINYLFKGGAVPPCMEEANANGDPDDMVDVGDVIYLINYLFKGGPSPLLCSGKSGGDLSSASRLPDTPGHAQISLVLNQADRTDANVLALSKASPEAKDQVFPISVVEKSDRDVAGVQLEIGFDPGEVTMLDPVLTPLTKDFQLYTSIKDGVQKIGIVDLTGEKCIPKGEGPLVMLQARGKNPSNIKITKAVLVDKDAMPLVLELSGDLKQGEANSELVKVSESKPTSFSLSQNYPNPFNPETDISYALPTECNVKLTIYNIAGQNVRTLVDEHQTTGFKTIHWNGRDNEGKELASGVYFYKIQAGAFTESRKMILMK